MRSEQPCLMELITSNFDLFSTPNITKPRQKHHQELTQNQNLNDIPSSMKTFIYQFKTNITMISEISGLMLGGNLGWEDPPIFTSQGKPEKVG